VTDNRRGVRGSASVPISCLLRVRWQYRSRRLDQRSKEAGLLINGHDPCARPGRLASIEDMIWASSLDQRARKYRPPSIFSRSASFLGPKALPCHTMVLSRFCER